MLKALFRSTAVLALLFLVSAFSARAQNPNASNAMDTAYSPPSEQTHLNPTLASMVQAVDVARAEDSAQASQLLLLPYRPDILHASKKYSLPAAFLAGVIQTETQWDPWATRFEPTYAKNPKIKRAATQWSKEHRGLPTALTELNDRARSMGLMQPMGQLARELGFRARYLSSLFLPPNSIDVGAHKLRMLFAKYGHDTLAVISAYNQGNARKRHGIFANARYVTNVCYAWQAWQHEFGEDTDAALDPTHSNSKANRIVPRSSPSGDRSRQRILEATGAGYEQAVLQHGHEGQGSTRQRESNRDSALAASGSGGKGESSRTEEATFLAISALGIVGLIAFAVVVVPRYAHAAENNSGRSCEGIRTGHA